MINQKHLLFLCAVIVTMVFLSCRKELFTGKYEARGVWMSRFEYATEKTRSNPDSAKALIRQIFRRARQARLNMVFFQVRGNATTFFNSSYEPWAQELTGTLGNNPGWDPLQFAVQEAHDLGLELHAWINTFPYWRGQNPPSESTPRQPFLDHPKWIVCDASGKPAIPDSGSNEYLWASPGNPSVRQHIVNVVTEIVRNYTIDGIHFDYVRYPEASPAKGYSHDSVSVARFKNPEGNPHQLTWEHWQREQVNQFIFEAYNSMTAVKPWIKVSAAVIGKYMGPGWSSYDVVYQDPRRWMEVGKIDFIVPMVYWEREHKTHPFVPLITQWQDRVQYDRLVIPGLSAGLQQRFGWEELSSEIASVREKGLAGVVFFSAGGLRSAWETLGVHEFPFWALPPRMPWKDSIAPAPPLNLSVKDDTRGVILSWQPGSESDVVSYILYRSDSPVVQRDHGESILRITGARTTMDIDSSAGSQVWYYAVAAVDRAGNESSLSTVIAHQGLTLAARNQNKTQQ